MSAFDNQEIFQNELPESSTNEAHMNEKHLNTDTTVNDTTKNDNDNHMSPGGQHNEVQYIIPSNELGMKILSDPSNGRLSNNDFSNDLQENERYKIQNFGHETKIDNIISREDNIYNDNLKSSFLLSNKSIVDNQEVTSGFESSYSLPKTFKGDHGGLAEDAALLAELRAISNRSSRNRFCDDQDSDASSSNANASNTTKFSDSSHLTEKKSTQPKSAIETINEGLPGRLLPSWNKKGENRFDRSDRSANDVVSNETPAIAVPIADYTADCVVQNSNTSVFTHNRPIIDKSEKPGFNSDFPKTVKDNRGGIAEDAELLAELREISNKSSQRFNGEGKGSPNNVKNESHAIDVMIRLEAKCASNLLSLNNENKEKVVERNDLDVAHDAKPSHTSPNDFEKNKPEQRKLSAIVSESSVTDLSVRKSALEIEGGFQSNLPNTFKGDRGGPANDADLLAELKAISNKSAPDRFHFGDGDIDEFLTPTKDDDQHTSNSIMKSKKDKNNVEAKSTKDLNKKMTSSPLPPWKRKKSKIKSTVDEIDTIIAVPRSSQYFDPIKKPSIQVNGHPKELSVNDELLLLSNEKSITQTELDVSEGLTSNFNSTFTGKNGGVAEDAELLAELKAISNRSNKRFTESGDDRDHSVSNSQSKGSSEIVRVSSSVQHSTSLLRENDTANKTKSVNPESRSTPPWKRKSKYVTSNEVIDDIKITIAAAPLCFHDEKSVSEVGLSGEHFAVPNKSSNERDGNIDSSEKTGESFNIDISSVNSLIELDTTRCVTSNSSQSIPPWKRKNDKMTKNDNVYRKVTAAIHTSSATHENTIVGTKPKDDDISFQPIFDKTFKGENGGMAEDADLLAELRQVGNKASSRFDDLDDLESKTINDSRSPCEEGSVNTDPTIVSSNESRRTHFSGNSDLSQEISSGTSSSLANESNITLDTIQESLKSSNWQVRKESYLFLQNQIISLLSDQKPLNQVDGERTIIPSIEKIILNALNEKNAGALDAALSLSILFVDCCSEASSENTLKHIASVLLKGAAFSSTRRSTVELAEELMLKQIEISPENSSSIHTILDLLQQHGLNSRKPKMVIFSAKLLLKSILEFGANSFPIEILSSHSEILLANSNNEVREVGLKIVAELCRTLGSKDILKSLIDKLKPSQQNQLDALLDAQSSPTQALRILRFRRSGTVSTQSPEEILAAMKFREEEDKANKFAARPAVDLLRVLPQTSYREKVKMEKWSEKVAALEALIHAGGEQPYKLLPPSNTVNYTPLVRELTQLLSHTHYAVVSKALESIGMLAEGVGEYIFPNLRPLITILVGLFKDKKVSKPAASCLDKMFAHVFSFEHLLDSKDSLPSSLDEKIQKNAVVRSSIMEFLVRCINVNGLNGTRGQLTLQNAEELSKLACVKLKDSDATTRKAANDLLLLLLTNKHEKIVEVTKSVTESLQSSNHRAYKSLQQAIKATHGTNEKIENRATTAPATQTPKREHHIRPSTAAVGSKPISLKSQTTTSKTRTNDIESNSLPSYEDAVDKLSILGMPYWSGSLEEGGILVSMQSTNWKARMEALMKLISHIESNEEKALDSIPSLFIFVSKNTSSFKESNFNVAKVLLLFFTAIFTRIHSKLVMAPEAYLYIPAIKLAAEKLSDKKLSETSASCLLSICVVTDPQKVMSVMMKAVGDNKSPLAHEAFLNWIISFCVDFGADLLSEIIPDMLALIFNECESNNMKVKKAALAVIGELHSQLGPTLEVFAKSKALSSNTIALIEKACIDNIYDSSLQAKQRKMSCLTISTTSKDTLSRTGLITTGKLSVPVINLIASLKEDCLGRMTMIDGKNSWKFRKEAMDEVLTAINTCGGHLATDPKCYASLKQVIVALRSRMNDSQSNLKPLAATVIGALLSHVDEMSQPKLGKSFFPSLVMAAMIDMKKTMRDASLSALAAGVHRSKLDGGGINFSALEVFILSLESEMSDAALKSPGVPDVLMFLVENIEAYFAQEDNSKTFSVACQLSKVIVDSLVSSKAGTRAAAEKLFAVCSKNDILPTSTLDTTIAMLLPAQQRTVRSVIPNHSSQEKELVDSFKKSARLQPHSRASIHSFDSSRTEPINHNSTSVKSSRLAVEIDHSPEQVKEGENPLAMNRINPNLKLQRLAVFGKGDDWPEYPEDVCTDAAQQTLRKSWATLIPPSSINLLFPCDSVKSMENCIDGCIIITESIAHSKNNNDPSLLEQLDLILKWAASVMSSRDHTVGLRTLLTMLLSLFQRIHELTYSLNDVEALILLPLILEKAGIVKSPFQDQFLNLISFVTSHNIYSLKQFGSIICVKVIEKSTFAKSRSLAANQCLTCVQSAGTSAIGKKGLHVLGRALSIENLIDNRTAYLDLFEAIIAKVDGGVDRLFSICGTSVSDKAKDMIAERCSKRHTLSEPSYESIQAEKLHHHSRLRTPLRVTSGRFGDNSPRFSERKHISDGLESSSSATASLRLRLHRAHTNKSRSVPPSNVMQPESQAQQLKVEQLYEGLRPDDSLTNIFESIDSMLHKAHVTTLDDIFVARGVEAIQALNLFTKGETSCFINTDLDSLNEQVGSNFNYCCEILASVLKFSFCHSGKDCPLPFHLIEVTVSALVGLLRSNHHAASISQGSQVDLLGQVIHSLLDSRLDAAAVSPKEGNLEESKATSNLVRAINKLAIRLAITPPRDISLITLITLQQAAVSADDRNDSYNAKMSRVLEKLCKKVIKEEYDMNPTSPLCQIDLDSLLSSLDLCLQTMKYVRLQKPGSSELLKSSTNMTTDLMTELLRCKNGLVRESIDRLELHDEEIRTLLDKCETELRNTVPITEKCTLTNDNCNLESKSATLASLINRVGKVDGEMLTDEIEELIKFKQSNRELFDSHLSQLSAPFKTFITDQLSKHKTPDVASADIAERIRSMNVLLQKSEESVPITRQSGSILVKSTTSDGSSNTALSARIEALKKKNFGQ